MTTRESKYTCETCTTGFRLKKEYTTHIKSASCISSLGSDDSAVIPPLLADVELAPSRDAVVSKSRKDIARDDDTASVASAASTASVEIKKMNLSSSFKNYLNILRDNEGLTGEKALRNMTYLLILKLIEPHIGTEIDFAGYQGYRIYDPSIRDDKERVKLCIRHYVELAHFSELAKGKAPDFAFQLKDMWNIILSQHPATHNIFLPGKQFDIKYDSTYKKLIRRINLLDLSNTEIDVLGNAYEEVIQDIMIGKVLGQFFTPPAVKRMMVRLINPQIHDDGTIDTCADPAMGTGGFLMTYLKCVLQQAAERDIAPNWEFIKNEGLYGKELEPDTYQLAVANMLISSGHMFHKLDRGDSIREPITRKFDYILANPPFGVKGLNYDDFKSAERAQYVPIRSNNAVSLFIQAIICMLKVGGSAAIVIPDGQDLFSKTNTTLVSIRAYLMKTCDVREIIYLPQGTFTHTVIKTCVLYFTKRREGTKVLTASGIKAAATGKPIKVSDMIAGEHATGVVSFYNWASETDIKTLIVAVPSDKIIANKYSLNVAEYIERQKDIQYSSEIEIKTIGELFTFESSTLQATKCDESGAYRVISVGNGHTHSTFVLDGTNIFIAKVFYGSGKTKMLYCDGLCNFTSLLYHMTPINPDIVNVKYMYYYLNYNVNYLSATFKKGSCNKSLDLSLFNKYKIPIPSLEKQHAIVTFLDLMYETAIPSYTTAIANMKEVVKNMKIAEQQYMKFIGCDARNEIKTIGELFTFESSTLQATKCDESGAYRVISVGNEHTHSTYIYDGKNLFIRKILGSEEKVRIKYYEGPCNFTSLLYHMTPINPDIVNVKYMYYYLNYNVNYLSATFKKGSCNKSLDLSTFHKYKIPIPSLEKQKEIIAHCEQSEHTIHQLEQQIEQCKKTAHEYMQRMLQQVIPQPVAAAQLQSAADAYDTSAPHSDETLDDAPDDIEINLDCE